MTENIKYCMVTAHVHKSVLFEEMPMRSGLYQWVDIFGGVTENWQNVDFEDYDVVHFNWCITDTGIFQDIVDLCKKASTKLVVNLDHTVDTYFNANAIPLPIIRRKWMEGADHYFATDEHSQKFLSYFVKKKVTLMQHPVDTKLLNTLRSLDRSDLCGVVYHWYQTGINIDIPYLVLKDLNQKRLLLGYIPGSDPKEVCTKNMYPMRQDNNIFASFIEKMNQCKLILDPYPIRSWGRATVEAAALGLPNVCSNLVDSSKRLYPKTMCDPFDIIAIARLTKKLLTDEKFYNEVAEHAYKESQYFSKENAKQRFLKMIEDE